MRNQDNRVYWLRYGLENRGI